MFSYTNRRGVSYYVHETHTKTGKRRYVVKRTADGALAKAPGGMEIVENVNGQVSIRAPRPRAILPLEEQQALRALAEHDRQRYRVEIKDRYITIHEPMGNAMETASMLDPMREWSLLGPALEKMMREKLGDATWDEYVRGRREEARQRREETMRYWPVLRFRLDDAQRSRFSVERMSYRGEGGWWWLNHDMTLAAACDKYIPLLGTEEMFDEI